MAIKVLYVIPYTMSMGGTEQVMMNLIRNFSSGVIVDVLETKSDKSGLYDDELQGRSAGSLFRVNSEKKFPFFLRDIKNVIRNGGYDVVHAHYLDDRCYFPLKIAFDFSVPVRIAHIHATKHLSGKGKLNRIFANLLSERGRIGLNRVATDYFACSQQAGVDYFDFLKDRSEFVVVKNAIDIEKYAFQETARVAVRKEFSISSEAFVIGQVGRLSREKNQIFTLEVFSEVLKKRPDSFLFFIGSGENAELLEERAVRLGIRDNVFFIEGSDSARFYSTMDCFLMPSLFEGFPLAAVEAQCNGLPCLLSERVPKEVLISPSSIQIPLSDKESWVTSILSSSRINSEVAKFTVLNKGYDVKQEAMKVEEYYMERVRHQSFR